MSANSAPPDTDGPTIASADQRYFRSLEDAFIRLRGAPLLLSPADWRQAQEWRREGIPLAVVVGALEEVFRRREERGAKGGISSLRYCKRAVEAAWSEAKELLLAAPMTDAPSLDVGSRLEALAGLLPAGISWDGLRQEILSLKGRFLKDEPPEGATEASVEAALAGLDQRALQFAEEDLNEDSRAQLNTHLDTALASLRRRLPEDQVEVARDRLRRGYLREQAGFPLLSLFAPEVEKALEEEDSLSEEDPLSEERR